MKKKTVKRVKKVEEAPKTQSSTKSCGICLHPDEKHYGSAERQCNEAGCPCLKFE